VPDVDPAAAFGRPAGFRAQFHRCHVTGCTRPVVAEGLTNPQISARLFISRVTVKTHLSHVFAKLNTTAINHGMMRSPEH
jgi:hypothetical protein